MSEIKYEIMKTTAPSALSGTSPKYDDENLGRAVNDYHVGFGGAELK